MVEGATPVFLPLVRHRAGGGGAPVNSHHLPSPSGVAPSTVIPGGKASGRPFASRWMSVPPCSFVTRLLLYVLLCVIGCTLFRFISESLPKPVNGYSASAQSGTSTSAPGCAPTGDEAFEEQQTTNGQRPRGASLTTRYLRSTARAACHPARRSRTKSLRGRTIARLVRQRPEWSNGFLFN